MTRERRIDMAPGEILDINAPTGMRVTYPGGKQSPKRIVTRDLGEWVEEPPTTEPPLAVEPPPVEPPPVTEPPPLIEPVPGGPVFYMAPSGSDSAAGSQLAPWRSLQRFINSNPVPGSQLLLRGGDYVQSQGGFSGRDSTYGQLIGTASEPITIRNQPGEVPAFPNMAGVTIACWPNDIANTVGTSYVVFDGLHFPSGKPSDEAVFVIGGAEPTLRLVNHVTLRNCFFSLGAGTTSIDHSVGLIHGAEDTTFEDCEFVGISGATTGGCGIAYYSTPAAIRTLVQRCIFRDHGWKGIQVWDYASSDPVATIEVRHCTFARNATDLDLRYHSTALVRDCVFDAPLGSTTIYDPNHSSKTTKDHNYFSQVLTSTYGLTVGSPAIGGAHDGTDAGAVPYP